MIKKSLQILKRNLSRPRGIDFESVYPVSDYYGDDRGTPVDRFYIDGFIADNRRLCCLRQHLSLCAVTVDGVPRRKRD